MPGSEEHFETCAECGATIYPEHLEKHMAEQFEGKLLCVYCLRDRRPAASAGSGDEATIQLSNEDLGVSPGEGGIAYDRRPTTIRTIGGGPGGMREGAAISEEKLRRSLAPNAPGATRCRIFHCKLADGAFANMCGQINEWADSSDDIQVKFATSCIGVIEGKHADAHLIVTVFY